MESEILNKQQELLDREFNSELQEKWSTEVAAQLTVFQEKTLSIVVFKFCNEWFGLDVECFRDVVSAQAVHSVPGRTTGFFDGVVNIEGELMLKVNPYHILGITQNPESNNLGKFMILEYEGDSFVIKADEFSGVEKLSKKQIIKAPALNNIEFHQALSELTKQRIESTDIHEQFNFGNGEENGDLRTAEEKSTVIMGIYERPQTSGSKNKTEEIATGLFDGEMTIGIIWVRRFFELLKSNLKW